MSEGRVWIAQCLCPQRHAILAGSAEAKGEAEAREKVLAPLKAAIAGMLAAKEINPWCGLCRAGVETWKFELGRTRFATMAEANPEMARLEAEQAVIRERFGDDLKTRH